MQGIRKGPGNKNVIENASTLVERARPRRILPHQDHESSLPRTRRRIRLPSKSPTGFEWSDGVCYAVGEGSGCSRSPTRCGAWPTVLPPGTGASCPAARRSQINFTTTREFSDERLARRLDQAVLR